MNKIFRIVWSQATQSWVAVSELTKAHKKQSSSNSQGSAVKFSGNFIKSSAVALALLSGHSAYAAINAVGTGDGNGVAWGEQSTATGAGAVALGKTATASASGAVALGQETKAEKNNGVAIGKGAQSTEDSAIALGFQSKSVGNWSVAIGLQTKATNKQAVAVGSKSQATGENSIAIGNAANASNESSVALGSNTTSTNKYTTAVGGTAFANQEGATALGYGARATNKNTIAIGNLAKAEQEGVIALGSTAVATGDDTIAIGNSATAKKKGDIILGKDAKSRDQGGGRSIAIGQRATAGSNRNGLVEDDKSTGLRGDDGSVAIGTNAYTGLNKNNTAVNNSVALGAGAGVGYRSVGADGKPLGVATDADDNDTVLVKAFGGTKATLTDFNNSGTANAQGFFSFQGVDINEGTALGRNTRAIGDQSVAIGAQSVAGMGSIVIGGNDIQAYDQKKYFKAANPTSGPANTVNDYDAPTTPGTGKNGQPITISKKYEELVGAGLDRSWRASYGQDGSTVIGMQAHSTTPLGVAIGTNSIVRKGAFGSTAIGSGASVVANAEAAVAIGMGAEAQGNYAVAAGTAARAKESAVAVGYQANAVESSVAVGHEAKSTKESDIAVGKGAIASGNQGAIAMGLGTNAQGDSSIMIGGANIESASKQNTTYEKGNGKISTKTVTEIINGHSVQREYSFAGTTTTKGTVDQAYKELTGRDMDTSAIDFADTKNKNGHASTSLGVHALSKGDLGTAIGASSRADAIGSVALGTGAHATKQNAVAIGTGSTTELVGTRQLSVSYNSNGDIVDDNSKDVAYTFNWAGGINTSEGDVVSFGSSGAERQLKNVAAGRVAEDSTDAINGSQLNSIAKKVAYGWNIAGDNKTQTASIGSEDQVNFVNGNGTTVTVTKQGEVKSGDKVTTPKGANVKFDIKAADGSITSNANGISVNTDDATIAKTPDGKLKANTGTINTGNDGKAAPNTGDGNKLATVDTVVNAVNNAAWIATAGNDGSGTETGKSEEKIKAGDVVTFKAGDNLAIKQDGKNFIYSLKPELTGLTSAAFKNAAGDTTVIDGNGMTITPKDAPTKPVSLTKDGLDNGGKTIKNVTSGLTNYAPGTLKAGLVDLSKPAAGTPVPDTTAATVGDLRNMGWVVSADKTTGELTKAYTDQVKNADEVKFVGEGGVTVSGKTENGVRTITVKAEAQEMPEQPVSYTTADGTKVYPKTVTKPDGTKEVKYYSEPNGKGNEIPKENVIASINGPEGTKAPTTLSNVAGNLDGAKKGTQAPITEHAPVNSTNAAGPNYVNPNNAATVGDVLNAGWNLQNNGTAKDFVKPYDTVNFVDGANTTAVVTTNADGTTSNVTYNVTGLPVTYTDKDGKPVAKVGDKYYPVNEKGQPVTPDGKPAVKTNEEGKLVAEDGTVIEPIDTKANPLQSNLVNPNVENTKEKPNNQTTSPTQLGNVANGANTFDTVEGKKLGNDGKWYNAADVLPNGQPKENVQPVAKPENIGKAGLIDFSNSTPNNAATVGDLQNLGWIVSASGNSYSDQVRNANEVKFVGEGTATVTGKTDENGVRTITVKVDDQTSTNNSVTPVSYTKPDGTKVYPKTVKNPDTGKEEVKFFEKPDGTGNEVPADQVVTSVNGPKGTKEPTALKNVKSNIPVVNDADKKVTNPDGTEKGTAGDVANINKAPLTATEAADLLNPTKDGQPNPNFVGNNAATVSDVLNAGWNLQNNGEARDFVKPFDTVNFVNGGNTTAVVTTAADGTTSDVTFNVTGLPITYTTADGKPVSKVGDKFYPVNEKGEPVSEQGNPVVGKNEAGDLVDKDGNVIKPIDTAKNPLKSNLVNPNVTNTTEKPNNQTTSPTTLNNVTSGLNKYGDTVDGAQVPGSTPANNGLVDLSKPADGSEPKVSDNTAATVGDLRNMGWIVSSDKTTGSLDTPYTDTVKNANEVKFVGEGTATVSGKTDDKGVRTITVKVDDQVSTNNAVTPVVYTDKDGNKVYPIKGEDGTVTYHTTPDGKGEGDKTVPADQVVTSVNGPKGTKAPTELKNVKNNIPAVNDADKKVTNPDGTEKGTAGDVANISKAPLTATEAADLLNPTKDGKANPNFVGNNAATVSDVLNAGWNLQNNGEARDFVKPFDTVNFVNGGNTTAVVTTAADGTTSDVTYNVTGLPITYTTADGKPVSKVGDKYYPVNEKGQPITADGKPAVKTNADGKPVTEDGTVIEPIDTKANPLQSNLVNPNVENTKEKPNNQTTSPTQLGNVANGAETFKPADDVKLANDGKWYPADQVEPNGKPKEGATPVASPLVTKNAAGDVLEKGNDGNWYKSSDLENGNPKPNATEQTPKSKPDNADKAGLINFENSNPNNAATVGDLQNMGFVVSAKDNGYTEQMRNTNKVEFKGDNGVQVTGKTLADGTREITVALKEGRVTNDVLITDKDGKVTHGVRGEDGKIYTKDPKTGKATKEEIPVKPSDTVENDGNAYVTGNSVATAIQKSGWNVGIGSTDKDFSTEAKTFEKVNPNDNVKYVNGANTTVSMAVDAAKDEDGTAVTTTYVKVDVNRDLNIDSVTTGGPAKDKAGNPLKQVNGEYYPENALVNDGKVYPAGTVIIDGKPYPAGSAKDPKTNEIVKDGKPAPEVQPLTATPKDQLADGKDGAMTVKDAKGNDGVSAKAKDGKGILTLKDAGKDGKDASQVDISTAKAPADLENTPKDAVRANDGNWYTPADVTVEVKDGKTVVTPKAGKTPIPNAPTMDRIQYTGTDGKPRNVATMDDGLRFVGDDGETISKPLNSTMEFTGGNRENGKPVAKENTTTGNIGVFHDNGKLSVQLAKDLEKMNSANFETPDGTSTKITGNGLSVTPETAKLKDPKTGKPVLDKDGNPKVDPKKVVSFGGPTIMKDPKTGKPVVDSKTGEPVMESGISAGGQVMTNVAPGRISPTSTDAVNGSQLHAVASSIGNLNNKINKVGKHADAGTASALAASNIPQAYTPGKSLVGIAAGSYQGQTGVAVGMSRISDNGKIIIRLSGTTNTQGRAGVAAGVGYQW
ncbi:YadA-like family protein [Haemophilus haemolyticus]|uniref:YadA-like family protein n=1 Tax=Haemophilus haemolyticus TaxID=726 RepID=UPI001066D3E8|nr:YadA-like family protein [Haemophilus haemolyticus]